MGDRVGLGMDRVEDSHTSGAESLSDRTGSMDVVDVSVAMEVHYIG